MGTTLVGNRDSHTVYHPAMPRRSTIPTLLFALAAISAGCGGFSIATLEPDELQSYALEHFAEREYRDAQVAFTRLITSYPAYAADPTTRLFLAHSHFGLREFVLAASEYKRVNTSFPRATEAAEASLGVCRSYVRLAPHPQRDQGFTDDAIISCLQTRQAYPATEVGIEADELYKTARNLKAQKEFEIGEFYFKDFPASSEIFYLNVANLYPDTDWAPEALLQLYRVYLGLGEAWDEEAAVMRSRLVTQYPDSNAARALENGG